MRPSTLYTAPRRLPPVSKYLELNSHMVNTLFNPEFERLYEIEVNLIRLNHQLGGSEYGFYYVNRKFCFASSTFTSQDQLGLVHPTLEEEASDFIKRNIQSSHDKARLTQALSALVSKANSYQDVRNLLPDILTLKIDTLSKLQRTKEPSELFGSYNLLMMQFNQAQKIGEYYTASNLIG